MSVNKRREPRSHQMIAEYSPVQIYFQDLPLFYVYIPDMLLDRFGRFPFALLCLFADFQ